MHNHIRYNEAFRAVRSSAAVNTAGGFHTLLSTFNWGFTCGKYLVSTGQTKKTKYIKTKHTHTQRISAIFILTVKSTQTYLLSYS